MNRLYNFTRLFVTMIPLLCLTKKPIVYSTFSYGGDDSLGFYEGLLSKDDPYWDERNKIRERYADNITKGDLSENELIEDDYDVCTLNMIRKINSENSAEVSKQALQNYRKLLDNENNRLKIVNALGGKKFCENIPIIYPKTLSDYMGFNLKDIPEGHSFAQYEDFAGRKGFLMKLRNKQTGEFKLAWFSQRYRETSSSGGLWMGHGACSLEGVDEIIDFIYRVKPNPHQVYESIL